MSGTLHQSLGQPKSHASRQPGTRNSNVSKQTCPQAQQSVSLANGRFLILGRVASIVPQPASISLTGVPRCLPVCLRLCVIYPTSTTTITINAPTPCTIRPPALLAIVALSKESHETKQNHSPRSLSCAIGCASRGASHAGKESKGEGCGWGSARRGCQRDRQTPTAKCATMTGTAKPFVYGESCRCKKKSCHAEPLVIHVARRCRSKTGASGKYSMRKMEHGILPSRVPHNRRDEDADAPLRCKVPGRTPPLG